jgi:hypothetical protein
MLEAVHKETEQPYYAHNIWTKFTNPREEKFYCCPMCKKPVTPVIGHDRIGGTHVISHFRIENKEEMGGCSTEGGESEEHKKGKILIASLIEDKTINLNINKTKIPYSSLKILEVPHIPWRWEQCVGNRRADILFKFIEWHTMLGLGIVLEIQISKLDEIKRKERTYDWIGNGYSVAWIEGKELDDNGLKTNEIVIQYPHTNEILTLFNDKITRMREENNKANGNIIELNELRGSCRTCKHANWDKNKKKEIITHNYLICWLKYNKGIDKRPHPVELLHKCKDYEYRGFMLQQPIN